MPTKYFPSSRSASTLIRDTASNVVSRICTRPFPLTKARNRGSTHQRCSVTTAIPGSTLEREVGAAVGNQVRVNVTGRPALDDAVNVHSKQDATRAEIIALPFLIVILLLVYRSVIAIWRPPNLAAASSGRAR